MHLLVLGMGQTGQSCLRYWSQQAVKVSIYDTREKADRFVELQQHWPGVDFFWANQWPELDCVDQVILSPGISPEAEIIQAIQRHDIEIISDIECFAQLAKAPIIGVTGTNGKSTTVTLIHDILLAAGYRSLLGGNIGTPALELLTEPVPDYYVLELSSFQLQWTHYLPLAAAIVLNIAPDHLDYHVDMAAYTAAKMRIVRQAARVWLPEALSDKHRRAVDYIPHIDHCVQKADMSRHLSMPHNQANVTAVWSVLSILLPEQHWQAAAHSVLSHFQGLVHRCQWFAEIEGVHWVNDSKGTNVPATIAAIESVASLCQGRLIWLAGGIGKGQDFTALSETVSQYVDYAVLLGQSADALSAALEGVQCQIECVQNLEQAVQNARVFAEAGDVVLFSPACASFDQFDNYQARGEAFMRYVFSVCTLRC